MDRRRKLRSGDRVRVRPLSEIAATLDDNGALDSLPFMPEMAAFVGRRFRVRARLEKTCVEDAPDRLRPRSLEETVVLDAVSCDGSAHEGCQRHCSLLWKEAWLELVTDQETVDGPPEPRQDPAFTIRYGSVREGELFFCQSTALKSASSPLWRIGVGQCTLEWRAGNASLATVAASVAKPLVRKAKSELLGLSSIQPVGVGESTPSISLGLQPGERVRVKSPAEISATLDRSGCNRGLRFTPGMVEFCGGVYTVEDRVDRLIDEGSGRMVTLRDTVILTGVVCDGGVFLGGCSRGVYHFWREAWLERSE